MTLLILLLSVAALVVGFAWFAPEIRDVWYFAPARLQAERAVDTIATHERLYRKRTGRFDTFTTGTAASHLRSLGVTEMPTDFLFDATETPNKGLRLRALPQSEPVLALKVGAQIYVTQLAPGGAVVERGWVP